MGEEGIRQEVAKGRGTITPLHGRIARLGQESTGAAVEVSNERGALITAFYESEEAKGKSVPVQRALAFKCLLERASFPVEDGQLIVGLKGTGTKSRRTRRCTTSNPF